MGELLRAICDATAINAQTAFYSASVSTVVANTGARAFARRNMQIQCKTDVWFLLMGWTMNTSFVSAAAPSGNWSAKALPSAFVIQDAKTSEIFGSSPFVTPKPLQGYTLNNMVWLPEFILWPPSSIINILADVLISTTAVFNDQDFVTLTGIEYNMPKGYAA